MKKERVAPGEAPFFRIATAVGTTEQEHRGKGIPTKAARIVGRIFPFPKNFRSDSVGRYACKRVATANPNRR